MANVAEERFLHGRQQRETERAATRDLSHTEATDARMNFNAAIAAFAGRVAALLTQTPPDTAAAMTLWRERQIAVAEANQTVKLTAYDIRSANSALAKALNDVERVLDQAASKTRFHFTRSVKPMGTNFRQTREGDGLGENADRCNEAGDVSNAIVDVSERRVVLSEDSTARFIRRCRDAVFHVVPVNGSCFIDDCHGCIFYVACHQLRINRCSDCHVYAWCRSTPVIEKSTELKFGGYDAWETAIDVLRARDGSSALECLDAYAARAGLDDMNVARAAYRHVADFTWLKQQASPNWIPLAQDHWKKSSDVEDTSAPPA
jgi:hypothetical protein